MQAMSYIFEYNTEAEIRKMMRGVDGKSESGIQLVEFLKLTMRIKCGCDEKEWERLF